MQNSPISDDTTVPSTQDLMAVMNFTDEDLEANQTQRLSPNQQLRLENMRKRILQIGGGLFFVFTVLATILIFWEQQNDSTILSIVGILLTICNAIMIGMLGRQWMRISTDLRLNEVELIQGEMERIVRASGRTNNFILRINEVEFSVKKEVFQQFRHEQEYVLYATPYTHILFSAEPLL